MKSKGYLVFHLNLGFSSIEEESWEDVIKSCYHPLLDLIEKTGVPIGIECSGWTLRQIKKIDPDWIDRFCRLLDSKDCELIGSGYCQIIGPLVPQKVNEWNQKIGLDIYNEILGHKPHLILVNEMAFSQSMVDLYSRFDYRGLIMDRDNIRLALDSFEVPSIARGHGNSSLPILWSDSILFQKVQHFAHGDIALENYLNYLKGRIDSGESLLAIYCNDVEVFDYRPGRFKEERPTHPDGEWNRLKNLITSIVSEVQVEIILPSEALSHSQATSAKSISNIVSSAYPVPVKKQAKYNIARWAVTGRDDTWLNTICHRIAEDLILSVNHNQKDWEELCELWASDLRTHITEKRWKKTLSKINNILLKLNINPKLESHTKIRKKRRISLEVLNKTIKDVDVTLKNSKTILNISTNNLDLDLNLRKGLAINSLSFKSHDMLPCIGTIPHGYFDSISLGANFYSGNTIIEMPLLRSRATDLDIVNPQFSVDDQNKIEISAEVKTRFGLILKKIEISSEDENISLSYDFTSFDKFFGSARLGIITLLNQFSDDNTKLLCANGGDLNEIYEFKGEFDHTKQASTLVSSSRGLGATTGKIIIQNKEKGLVLDWDPALCTPLPMLSNTSNNGKTLSRIMFSIKEFDDTVKNETSLNNNFKLNIST